MEIEIYSPSQGEALPPVKWNYEQLKAQLTEGLEAYKGRVYDEDSISEAKKDRAALNKLATAIDTRRKEMKERFLQPYEEFEAQAKELTAMVKEQSAEIDAQIKAYDEARKEEKLGAIKEVYAGIMGDLLELVPYEKIHDKKWLNVTTSMKSIEKEITEHAESIRAALASIDALSLSDDMQKRVKSVYLDGLDLAAALAEKEKIEREQQALADYEAAKKAAQERAAQEKAVKKKVDQEKAAAAFHEHAEHVADEKPSLITIDFRVQTTPQKLQMLKAFLHDNEIKYGRVPK